MAWKSFGFHFTTLFFAWSYTIYAQTISTDTPVPPLQWINISGLLQGTSRPPPLKDAAIGYDETSRSLIIFGGESASGFVQSETYLSFNSISLNLDTLTWSTPSPPATLQQRPSPRSATVFGGDFAASNRHGFVVIGGKGSDGKALADVWEYDFNNQFWSEVDMPTDGPLPRWGAAGGIDISTPPSQDPVVPGPNNTFYLAGGYDGIHPSSLSDVWRLNISGTLSSNLPNSAVGSWDNLKIGNLPAKLNQASAVVFNQIIVTGGCDAADSGGFCAGQDSYVIDVQQRSEKAPGACPAPRLSPVLVPNENKFSARFASQVYLLLGTIDSSKWHDDGGLQKGEVAVLDVNTGSWSRILPSGDPGFSGKLTWPTPREGVAAFSYDRALVGQSRDLSSDVILFGGRDSLGNLSSEVWILRAFRDTVTPSRQIWSGFGNGILQTGVNSNGAGVRIEYMTSCASAIISGPSSSSAPVSSSAPTATPTATSTSKPSVRPFDASMPHKILSPLSLAILQLAFIVVRVTSPSHAKPFLVRSALYGALLTVYALGIAGLATSFSSILSTSSVPSNPHLKTGHGIAGLVLFVCLYCLLPALIIAYTRTNVLRHTGDDLQNVEIKSESPASPNTEKTQQYSEPLQSASQSLHDASSPSSPRPRTNSWGPSSVFRRSPERRFSSDSESASSVGRQGGFEVVNRPARVHRASWQLASTSENENISNSRSLGEIDWLRRRRSLNAVGELDYAISQAQRAQSSNPAATAEALMIPNLQATSRPQFPRPLEFVLRVFVQALLLSMSILTLIILWRRAPRFAFALFLAWSLAFYVVMFIFSWHLRPQNSVLSVFFSQIRSDTSHVSDTSSAPVIPNSNPSSAPYTHHQPAYRVTPDDVSLALRSVESNTPDDDVDEYTTQRRIEEEMGRRDVSIVTIPRRRLWVANPS